MKKPRAKKTPSSAVPRAQREQPAFDIWSVPRHSVLEIRRNILQKLQVRMEELDPKCRQ